MATRKTAAKAAKKTSNQKAAAKRTAKKAPAEVTPDDTRVGAPISPNAASIPAGKAPTSPTSDVSLFGNADNETQKSASVAAQQQVSSFSLPDQAQAVSLRVSAVEAAVADRDAVLNEEANKAVEADLSEQASVHEVMTDLTSAPKAPLTNAYQKPQAVQDVGIHPDVTSPTNLMADQVPRLPGTGVADPRDLAPGQDMSPSPPVSSSNIVPTPTKPGTNFSKV